MYEDKAGTVRANAGDNRQAVVVSDDCYAIQGNCIDRSDTARTLDLNGGNPAYNQGGMAVCVGNGQLAQAKLSEKVGALNCMHDQQAVMVSYGVDCYNQSQSKEMIKAITSAATDADHIPCTYNNNSVVRRLTPTECERLQNYPDGWTDIGEWVDTKGKKHKAADSPRYKALGNSIALPFWQWMADRMVRLIKNDESEKEPTMASLFDGIGGFPLVYSRCGCKPVWASEVEEFAIAVTKRRFPEDATPHF